MRWALEKTKFKHDIEVCQEWLFLHKCVGEKNRFMLEESKGAVDKVDEDVHSINS